MRRLALTLILAAGAVPMHAATASAQSEPSTTLPLVVIDAPNGIVDEPKRTATMRVIDNESGENHPTDPGNDYDGSIGIELRGFTSLRFDKKSYSLETRKPSGKARNVSLLGMPKDDDWVLIANYRDKSLLRNVVAYSAARSLGRYASRTRLVEVVLNGSYEGVYVLAEKLKLQKHRVAVDDSAISGGYLLELTAARKLSSGDRFFRTPATRRGLDPAVIAYTDPNGKDLSKKRARWIRGYVNRFERRLYGSHFRDPRRGYRPYLDVGAAVDYLLLEELFKNGDTFEDGSTYMHKSVGGKLVFGPVWDFDQALGNTNAHPVDATTDGWLYAGRRWAGRLYADPYFRKRMASRWRHVRRGLIAHIMRSIDDGATELSAAQASNFTRWPILGVSVEHNPPDPRTGELPQTYPQEISYLKWWLTGRARWISSHIGRLRP